MDELRELVNTQSRWLSMHMAGKPPTPEMMEAGQYFFDVNGEQAQVVAREKQGCWLDVRTEAEVQAGIIPGATWIPMDQIEARLDELPRDAPLIVYCAAGARSASVCQFLGSQGFQDLHNLEGGMGGWSGPTAKL